MKLCFVLILAVFLTGCELFSRDDSQTTTETVYRPIFPPVALTLPCYPERPQSISLGDLVVLQSDALDQCNAQLKAIRDWREREERGFIGEVERDQ